MVDTTGVGSEIQSSALSQGTYSQAPGLVVESVNLCRVDYCILCALSPGCWGKNRWVTYPETVRECRDFVLEDLLWG